MGSVLEDDLTRLNNYLFVLQFDSVFQFQIICSTQKVNICIKIINFVRFRYSLFKKNLRRRFYPYGKHKRNWVHYDFNVFVSDDSWCQLKHQTVYLHRLSRVDAADIVCSGGFYFFFFYFLSAFFYFDLFYIIYRKKF